MTELSLTGLRVRKNSNKHLKFRVFDIYRLLHGPLVIKYCLHNDSIDICIFSLGNVIDGLFYFTFNVDSKLNKLKLLFKASHFFSIC